MHENGCVWDERTCTYAAESERLDVLKYAHQNSCPWDARHAVMLAPRATWRC